jgi:hypothetical protein
MPNIYQPHSSVVCQMCVGLKGGSTSAGMSGGGSRWSEDSTFSAKLVGRREVAAISAGMDKHRYLMVVSGWWLMIVFCIAVSSNPVLLFL